jgi:hypothetical protein
MDGKIESIMNQSVSLLDAEISNIEQVLVLIQDFYQYFDYPYTPHSAGYFEYFLFNLTKS